MPESKVTNGIFPDPKLEMVGARATFASTPVPTFEELMKSIPIKIKCGESYHVMMMFREDEKNMYCFSAWTPGGLPVDVAVMDKKTFVREDW